MIERSRRATKQSGETRTSSGKLRRARFSHAILRFFAVSRVTPASSSSRLQMTRITQSPSERDRAKRDLNRHYSAARTSRTCPAYREENPVDAGRRDPRSRSRQLYGRSRGRLARESNTIRSRQPPLKVGRETKNHRRVSQTRSTRTCSTSADREEARF